MTKITDWLTEIQLLIATVLNLTVSKTHFLSKDIFCCLCGMLSGFLPFFLPFESPQCYCWYTPKLTLHIICIISYNKQTYCRLVHSRTLTLGLFCLQLWPFTSAKKCLKHMHLCVVTLILISIISKNHILIRDAQFASGSRDNAWALAIVQCEALLSHTASSASRVWRRISHHICPIYPPLARWL